MRVLDVLLGHIAEVLVYIHEDRHPETIAHGTMPPTERRQSAMFAAGRNRCDLKPSASRGEDGLGGCVSVDQHAMGLDGGAVESDYPQRRYEEWLIF